MTSATLKNSCVSRLMAAPPDMAMRSLVGRASSAQLKSPQAMDGIE
jgi:hypothetical protein